MNPSLRPALGSLAAMAALSLPLSAQAQATLSSISNLTVQNGDYTGLDLDGDGTTDFYVNNITAVFRSADVGDMMFSNAGSGVSLQPFAFGSTIAAAGDTTNDLDFSLLTGETGYIGVSFENITGTHAGWLLLDLTASNGDIVIDSAGWEATAGASIAAGSPAAVPEPATAAAGLGLLAGLAAWFRRRRAGH